MVSNCRCDHGQYTGRVEDAIERFETGLAAGLSTIYVYMYYILTYRSVYVYICMDVCEILAHPF